MKGAKLAGLLIIVIVVAGAIAWRYLGPQGTGVASPFAKKIAINGFIGSEKANFLDDEAVKKALAKRRISVEYSKAGSIEMVIGGFATKGSKGAAVDFLWPSSAAALELYRQDPANPKGSSEIAFSSPLVLYTWTEVAESLVKAGYAKDENGVLYLEGFAKLLERIEKGSTWADAGVPGLYGKVGITSTDPAKSNSGLLWACLLGTVLNGDVPDAAAMKKLLPRIDGFFKRIGYMENSTGNLFEEYLRIGQGQYPLIVGYENQLAEFRLANPELWKNLESKVRVIYPVPTVWSNHPLIALDSGGEALLKALREPELQTLAWKNHGFRAGIAFTAPSGGATKEGGGNASEIGLQGLPEQISRVAPLPSADALRSLVSFISEN